jgi:DNA modification methylase
MAKAKAKEIKSVEDLTLDGANVNRGTERGRKVIDWSITELGAGRSILADASGNVLAGNKTTEVALNHGLPVRVIQTDGSELVVVQRTDLDLFGDGKERERARQLAIADNRTQTLSYSEDVEVLLEHAQGVDLAPLYAEEEIAALMASLTPEMNAPGAGGDDFDTTPEETQTRVRYGDLWQCGEHRVLCGDSTKAEDVARVMDGKKAVLMNTDPPYGIAYVSNAQTKDQAEDYAEIANDELDGEKLQAFLEQCIRAAVPHLVENAAFYLWHPMPTQGTFFAAAAAAAADILIHRQIIWVKPSMVFGRGDYHWRHELCFYGWRRGHRPAFYGERNQTTVWEIGRENDKVHPTQKPVDLFVAPIRNHTKRGDVVYEPFAGSGSQFIAAEREGRKCYGLELEPKYVNVILSRWEAETGKQAVLLERNGEDKANKANA